ncbi:MAG: hypothetical protein MJZ74_04390 [Muribaculaceae bacterium]|nr:hypothetical protein [Muribaculaceae bacterium]
MKRNILSYLASMVLLCITFSCNAQTVTPAQVTKQINADILELKKEMLDVYPQFRSTKGINTTTAASAIKKLERRDNQMSYNQAAYLNELNTHLAICNWYSSKINTAKTTAEKNELANEYIELDALMENISTYASIYVSVENMGGSMKAMVAASASREVYSGWLKAIKKTTRLTHRATTSQAEEMVETMRNNWEERYNDMRQNFIDEEGYLSSLNEDNDDVQEALNNISALVSQKGPYKWVLDVMDINPEDYY